MAGPNKPDDIDPQIRANMGKYLDRAKPVTDQLKPGKAPQPKVPGVPGQTPEIEYEKQGGTGKGKAPPFPIVASQSLAHFKEAKQTDADTFGFNQSQAFDPELNELALREVAQARGMTVEQLLESRADRKAEVKLRPADQPAQEANPVQEQPAQAPRSFITPEEEEILRMEMKIADMKQRAAASPSTAPSTNAEDLTRRLAEKQMRAEKKNHQKSLEEEKAGVPKEYHDNPVIERLREKLSIEAIQPCRVTIEDIKFEMRPPPSSLSMWILEKIHAGQSVTGDGAPLAFAIKIATVAAAITKIEGKPIMQALGLDVSEEQGQFAMLICAQTLWEMFLGLPSRKDLFEFDPELAFELYKPYKAAFGERNLVSSFKEPIHRYVCPVPECMEMYDLKEFASGVPPFCKVHGVPMDDKGLLTELRSVPLV